MSGRMHDVPVRHLLESFSARANGRRPFDKVVAEIAEHPETHSFIPMLQNEPLLDKKLFDRLRRFRDAGGRQDRARDGDEWRILTDAVVENIRDVNLDILDISLDALTKETYEKIRIGLDFDQVMAGVERVIAADLPRTKILVRLVRQRDNFHEIKAFAKRWRSRGVGVFIYSAHDRAGSVVKFDERIRIPASDQTFIISSTSGVARVLRTLPASVFSLRAFFTTATC